MSLQNHNSVYINQTIKELEKQYPYMKIALQDFKSFAERGIKLWKEYGITIIVDNIKIENENISYELKAQADSNDVKTLALLQKFTELEL